MMHTPSKRRVREFAAGLLASALLFMGTGGALSQNQEPIGTVRAINNLAGRTPEVAVTFTNPLTDADTNLDASNIVIATLPSGTTFTGSRFASPPLPLGTQLVSISLPQGSIPAGDTLVQVTFGRLEFDTGTPPTVVVGANVKGEVIGPNNARRRVEQITQAMQAVAPAKTADERNVFAALNLEAAPDESTKGAADVALNFPFELPFVTSGNGTVRLKKGATTNGDPRVLDIGLGFRQVIFAPAVRRRLAELRQQIHTPDSVPAPGAFSPPPFLGFLVSGGVHLEGDALQFNVTNFVTDVSGSLLFPVFQPFGQSSQLSLRVMPAGVEVGRNVSSDGTAEEGEGITRLKSGGELVFSARAGNQPGGPSIEFSLSGIGRYLAADEQQLIPGDTVSRTIHGFRGFAQASGRLLLVNTDAFRVGVGLTYHHGMLPPTFQLARAFQFGLIFETADDKHKAK